MTLKTTIWNITGTPYYKCRLIDSNFKVIKLWFEKDLGQKAVSCESMKFSGIIPKTQLIQSGNYRELLFHEKDARPITEVDLESLPPNLVKKLQTEHYHLFFTREIPLKRDEKGELDIGKIASTHPITKDIPGEWLYETLRSTFIPQIMKTPDERFAWLREVLIVAVIGVMGIAAMAFAYYMLKG
jgi:hypothetical protein